jgi:hypothetical protein
MHWIVTRPRDAKWVELHELLVRTGTPHTVVSGGEGFGSIVPDVSPEGAVLCLGSHALGHVARAKGWRPGIVDIGWLGYRECLDAWGPAMLNADAVFCRFDGIERAAASLRDTRAFLRPAYDSKAFEAGVVDVDDVAGWKGTLTPLPADDAPCMACIPKAIHAEWRTWIVSGEVATASLYRRGGKALFDGRDVPEEVTAFAATSAFRLSEHFGENAPSAYVLDVALTEGGCRIVEVNGIAGARLYDCDIGRLFGALSGLEPSDAPSPGSVM